MVSTVKDLLTFYQALNKGKLISLANLQRMKKFKHKFRTGLYYGHGMIEFRLENFFFYLGIFQIYPEVLARLVLLCYMIRLIIPI